MKNDLESELLPAAALPMWDVPVEVERVIRVKTTIPVAARNKEHARRLACKAMRRVSTLALAVLPGSVYSPAPMAGDPAPSLQRLALKGAPTP